jgi:cytochrome P450
MFGGGSDTAATMLQWIMAELISKPQLMHKAQEEVRREFVGHTKVTEDGIKNLDFMHMVIKETLRLHPPLLLLLPRECQSDNCKVLGYDVPKGTIVLVNAWAINRDPHH